MSAYVALPDAGSEHREELLRDHISQNAPQTNRHTVDPNDDRRRSDIRLRSGLRNAARSLAISAMVMGVTLMLFACAAIPTPKVSPLSSLIVVAVFAALLLMAVALFVLIRDDQVESQASNLLFFVICAMFFTTAVAFLAMLFSNQERMIRIWQQLSPSKRRHLTNQLNHHRSSPAFSEEQAGLIVAASNSTTSLQFGLLSIVLLGIQIMIAFPLYMMKHIDEASMMTESGFQSISRSLQEAGLL